MWQIFGFHSCKNIYIFGNRFLYSHEPLPHVIPFTKLASNRRTNWKLTWYEYFTKFMLFLSVKEKEIQRSQIKCAIYIYIYGYKLLIVYCFFGFFFNYDFLLMNSWIFDTYVASINLMNFNVWFLCLYDISLLIIGH